MSFFLNVESSLFDVEVVFKDLFTPFALFSPCLYWLFLFGTLSSLTELIIPYLPDTFSSEEHLHSFLCSHALIGFCFDVLLVGDGFDSLAFVESHAVPFSFSGPYNNRMYYSVRGSSTSSFCNPGTYPASFLSSSVGFFVSLITILEYFLSSKYFP